MSIRFLLCSSLLLGAAVSQVAVFPSEYSSVPEGPWNSPNLPLARGVSRVMLLYETSQLAVPVGNQITAVGFREDGQTPGMDTGRTLQLEVRMGYTTRNTESMLNNFDNNFDSTPVTVFGPALYQLPNLRDFTAPLPNGEFFIQLTTPFQFSPPPGQNLLVEYRVFGTSGGGNQFNYRLDRASYHSPVTYGSGGCPHSGGGTPSLTVNSTRPGLSYVSQLTDGPANTVGVLALNVGASLVSPYPLAPVFEGIASGCQGELSPTGVLTLGAVTSGGGTESWAFPIPNNNLLSNLSISSQALLLDFFAPGGVVVSNGAEVVIGLRPRCTILAAGGAPTVVATGLVTPHYCPVSFFEHQ